jgi:hypothetical protein
LLRNWSLEKLNPQLHLLLFLCIFRWQIDQEWSHVHRRRPCLLASIWYICVLADHGKKLEIVAEWLKHGNIEPRITLYGIPLYFWDDKSI